MNNDELIESLRGQILDRDVIITAQGKQISTLIVQNKGFDYAFQESIRENSDLYAKNQSLRRDLNISRTKAESRKEMLDLG